MMESQHIVSSFDDDLAKLDNLIAEMGGLAETQLAQAIDALTRRDAKLAQIVADADVKIDALERQIDALTIEILARRQPLARDLRIVVSALKTANSLERVGDYSRNICKRTLVLSRMPAVGGATATIARMGRLVQHMIRNVLDAYIARDVDRANDVWERDEEVDQLNTSLFRELLTYMMEDPRHITACTHLLFIAKNIERMGDHVTNIAEHVRLMVLGEQPPPDRPKDDRSSLTVATPEDGNTLEQT